VSYLKRLTDEQWVIIDPSSRVTFRSLAAIAISFAAMQFAASAIQTMPPNRDK
jgi:hypothetical protein